MFCNYIMILPTCMIPIGNTTTEFITVEKRIKDLVLAYGDDTG